MKILLNMKNINNLFSIPFNVFEQHVKDWEILLKEYLLWGRNNSVLCVIGLSSYQIIIINVLIVLQHNTILIAQHKYK